MLHHFLCCWLMRSFLAKFWHNTMLGRKRLELHILVLRLKLKLCKRVCILSSQRQLKSWLQNLPSENSELTCSKAFHNCSHFLTRPLEKPLIESLGFPEFGNFHNSRFFMTNPLVQAVIRGLAFLEQNTSTTIDKISLRMEDRAVHPGAQ